MTPVDIIKSVKDTKTFVMNTIKNNTHPMIANLIDMANKGDNAGVEKFARNFCKSKGIDFDKEYKDLMGIIK